LFNLVDTLIQLWIKTFKVFLYKKYIIVDKGLKKLFDKCYTISPKTVTLFIFKIEIKRKIKVN